MLFGIVMHYSFANGKFLFFLRIFDEEFTKTNTETLSDTLLLIILFFSFNDVSKIEFVNILSVKETLFDAALNGLVITGM